jgi:hypothetical protein
MHSPVLQLQYLQGITVDAFTKRRAVIFRAKLANGTIAIIAAFKATDTFTSSAVAFLITGTGFV